MQDTLSTEPKWSQNPKKIFSGALSSRRYVDKQVSKKTRKETKQKWRKEGKENAPKKENAKEANKGQEKKVGKGKERESSNQTISQPRNGILRLEGNQIAGTDELRGGVLRRDRRKHNIEAAENEEAKTKKEREVMK